MKKSKYILILLTILFFIVGCVPKPIDLELEQLEQKPVVWSQIIPGDVVLFYFARSFSSLNENQDSTTSQDFLNQILVENGSMKLTHQGITEELSQLNAGIWNSSTTSLNVGDFYTIEGTDDLLHKTITSTTQLLPTVTMDNLFETEISYEDTIEILKIKYHINDVPGDNWYLVNAYTGNFDNFGNLEGDSLNTINSEVASQIITDQTYNSFDIANEIFIFDAQSDTIIVTLSNITEDYYNYLALRKRGGSVINQLTSEPINYPSNVENGYGYFNLVIPDFKMVIVE